MYKFRVRVPFQVFTPVQSRAKIYSRTLYFRCIPTWSSSNFKHCSQFKQNSHNKMQISMDTTQNYKLVIGQSRLKHSVFIYSQQFPLNHSCTCTCMQIVLLLILCCSCLVFFGNKCWTTFLVRSCHFKFPRARVHMLKSSVWKNEIKYTGQPVIILPLW